MSITSKRGLRGPQGERGERGPGVLNWRDEWQPGEYQPNDAVRGKDGSYICKVPTSSEPPGPDWGVLAKDGRAGAPGRDGKDGRDGVDGKDGVDGRPGEPGLDGKDGVDGKDGIDGKPGRDGVDGKPGRDGVDGKPGRDGEPGQPGRDGNDGKPGLDGAPGQDGRPGTGPIWRGQWTRTATYQPDDLVRHDNVVWICIAENRNQPPPSRKYFDVFLTCKQ